MGKANGASDEMTDLAANLVTATEAAQAIAHAVDTLVPYWSAIKARKGMSARDDREVAKFEIAISEIDGNNVILDRALRRARCLLNMLQGRVDEKALSPETMAEFLARVGK